MHVTLMVRECYLGGCNNVLHSSCAGPAGHLALPHLILERVRLVSPGPLQGAPPNPAAAAHPGDLAAANTACDMIGAAVEGGRYVMYWMQVRQWPFSAVLGMLRYQRAVAGTR
jgi:hypothetical protein